MRRIFIGAMKRSGHHAVINWLCRSWRVPVVYHNNCEHVQIDGWRWHYGKKNEPFQSEILAGNTLTIYEGGEEVFHSDTHDFVKSQAGVGGHCQRLQELDCMHRKIVRDHVSDISDAIQLYSFEDVPLKTLQKIAGEQEKLLIVRDPYNWVASRMKYGIGINEEILKIWLQHATISKEEAHGWTHINFGDWASDSDYRTKLAKRFGFTSLENSLSDVPGFGNGSSFDGLKYRGEGKKMAVTERWMQYQHDLRYLSIFKAFPELRGFDHTFGFSCNVELPDK